MHQSLTFEKAVDVISGLPVHQSVMIWGGPGIGKTDLVRALCERWNARLVTCRLSDLMREDMAGIPDVSGGLRGGVTTWNPPGFLRDLCVGYGDGGSAVLFLDELTNALPEITAAIQYLLLDRTIGVGDVYRLRDNVRVLAAGNREEDGAGTYSLTSPVASRVFHVHLEPELGGWVRWATESGIHHQVVGFVLANTHAFYAFSGARHAGGPFACPRSWHKLSAAIGTRLHRFGEDPLVDRALVHGFVGPAEGDEFLAYMHAAVRAVSADEVIARPDLAPTFDDQPDISLVVIENVVHAVRARAAGALDATLTYAQRLRAPIRTLLHKRLLNSSGELPPDVLAEVLAHPRLVEIQASLVAEDDLLVNGNGGAGA